MAKAEKKKAPKPRASKYDPKLAVNGSFADVIKVSVSPTHKEDKPQETAKNKK
ncbi:hypothetical protein SAMN05444410_101450 [Hydrobacter penzbergensis]|uniref:Uncharacterized protein n=1 Tax=Hydrobacter penzbergensis TaxID=1235997 RepID=A0A8X8LDM0_9BACT|nr:hypothetical protein [Hydrobacter penzbergensis]SDW18459.1 hypothetical protein SAMN05444410_101450 [Hydrobacter penzbergensis]